MPALLLSSGAATAAALVPLGLVLLGVLWGVLLYNGLVLSRNRTREAWSGIDVQLKRRHDLIPNLVEVAKGYMSHERETLEAVIHARNQAVTAQQKAATSPGDPSAMTGVLGNNCGPYLNELKSLAEKFRDAMRKADEKARHDGVFPGTLRDARRTHRLEFPW